MTEAALAELFTQGGIGAVLVVVVFFGGRWFGREMVGTTKELVAEVKRQGDAAATRDAAESMRQAERHTAVVAALGDLSERIGRVEARNDEFDEFDETTPVRGLRPVRNGKRP